MSIGTNARTGAGAGRRRMLGALAMAALLLLSACAGIPGSGQVNPGQPLPLPVDVEPLFLPSGPALDAEPEQILRGFLAAASNSRSDYAIARQFLTEEASAKWRADTGVLVHSTRLDISPDDDSGGYAVQVRAQYRVDDAGHFSDFAGSRTFTLDFQLEQEAGQWRISEAPDGIVLSASVFASVFAKHSLYFFDPQFRYLVPDVRWFASDSAPATRIVKALLEGPSEWLGKGVVVSAFPEGSALSLDTITVESGRARVDLTQVPGSQRQLQRMRAQLSQSLSSLSSISSVVISVDFNDIDIPALGADAPRRNPLVAAAPLVVQDGQLGTMDGTQLRVLEDYSELVMPLEPRGIVLSMEQRRAAVLGPDGVSLIERGQQAQLLDDRAGLIVPSLDPHGVVWSVPAGVGGGIQVADAAQSGSVTARWLEDSAVRSMQLSRDGTRLLLAVRSGEVSRLLVAGVLRDGDGWPTGLGEPVALTVVAGEVQDASWFNESVVVSLWRQPGTGRSTVLQQEIGGQSSSRGELAGAERLAGGNMPDGLRVLDAEGELWELRGSNWLLVTEGVEVLGTFL